MKRISMIFILFIHQVGFSQTYPRDYINLEALVDKLTPIASEDLNYEEIYENIFALYQSPLDLNKVDKSDLSALFFLSERQINDILDHRKKFGNFLSLYELQSVESLTLDDIRNLIPFITLSLGFGDVTAKGLLRRASEHYLVFRADQTLEKSKGFLEEKYVGSRQRFYTRYRMSRAKDFSLGFISEKDPGEKNFFDYTAFHVQLQNKGNLKNLVVGDYLVQFGQGLIFSAGYVAGKGGEPVYTTRRSNLGARPYNSLIENGSFRGAASTYKVGNVEITGIYSQKSRDASVSEATETSDEYFSSLLTAGMHRTETEIANKGALRERNIGGNLLYRLPNLQFGFSVLNTQFDKSFQKRDLLYNYFDFTGKSNTIAGPNISVFWQNFNFFGEMARSSSGGYGHIVGFVGSLGRQVEWAMNHRNYQPDFHTLYGNAFSESSRTINERGIYMGLKYIIKKGLEVTGYYDSYSFPWLKFRVDAPSNGHDYQLRINYRPNKKFSSYLAFRSETKQRNPSGINTVVRELAETDRKGLVLNGEYIHKMFYKFQTKIQYNGFGVTDQPLSNGLAFIQDIEAKFNRIQLKTRFAYFNTDTYDSRIYAYENDVLYAVSFPALNGRGFRYYILTKLPVTRNLEAWVRVAQTSLMDATSVGSGNDLIKGNTKTDMRVQLKYKLR